MKITKVFGDKNLLQTVSLVGGYTRRRAVKRSLKATALMKPLQSPVALMNGLEPSDQRSANTQLKNVTSMRKATPTTASIVTYAKQKSLIACHSIKLPKSASLQFS